MSAPHEDAQTATEATRDTETTAGTEGGRDDLRATIARVRALAEAAERTGCGAGWTLDPAAVLFALDRPGESQ